MLVEVYHDGIKVAEVYAPDGWLIGENLIKHSLQYAFRRTQNIDGSWSQPLFVEAWGHEFADYDKFGTYYNNSDYSEDVKVCVPLHEEDGKVYGLRSSMVGDIFKIDEAEYIVADFGFERVG